MRELRWVTVLKCVQAAVPAAEKKGCMRMRRYLLAVGACVIVWLAVLITGCGEANLAKRNRSLYLAPGATRVLYTTRHGEQQVTYSLSEEYPAKTLVKQIGAHLSKQGWKPLKMNFLNPGIPNSFSKGWTDYFDGQTKPELHVWQWWGDWERGGNILTYSLEYRCPTGAPEQRSTVRVMANYSPRENAERFKAYIKTHPAKH